MIVSAIATAGLLSSAGKAFAQAAPADSTVNFTGTVGSVCVFSNVVNGILGNDGFRIINASLSPTQNLGTPGSVDLACTNDVELSVSTPQENGSTADLLSNADIARGAVGTIDDVLAFLGQDGSGNTSGTILGPVDQTFDVGMYIEADQPIPEGVYSYNVIVTATPL